MSERVETKEATMAWLLAPVFESYDDPDSPVVGWRLELRGKKHATREEAESAIRDIAAMRAMEEYKFDATWSRGREWWEVHNFPFKRSVATKLSEAILSLVIQLERTA